MEVKTLKTTLCITLTLELIKWGMQGHMRPKNVFMTESETHIHKWGRVEKIKPNDFQVHSWPFL
jgi:hypothetical protein